MTVNNISVSSNYNLMKKALDAAEKRGEAIAQNKANVNTENYKKYVVSFEDSLKDSQRTVIKGTSPKHIAPNRDDTGEIKVTQDTATSLREDGNNVDIDLEKVNQAANSLMYNALITEANSRLSSTRYVINGGGR